MNSPAPDTISIFFAANVDYYQHLCVLLVSILENNTDNCFAFYVITDKEDVTEKGKITGLKERYKNFEIHFIVIDDSKLSHLPSPPNYLTIQCYYRFLIPEFVPELDKVLYFDSDMICCGNLQELWDIPLENNDIAGVADIVSSKDFDYLAKIGFSNPLSTYINTGVLIINLQNWRKEGFFTTLIDTTIRLAGISKFADQDTINVVCQGHIKLIDVRYNFVSAARRQSPADFCPVICHFTGSGKPWSLHRKSRHPFRHQYWRYLKLSPYRHYVWKYRFWHIPMYLQYEIKKLIGIIQSIFRKK